VGFVNVIRNAERFLCDAHRPLRLGETIDLTDVRIRVTATTPDGRAGEAAFQFAEPLESPRCAGSAGTQDAARMRS